MSESTENIATRLKHFFEVEGISPAQFADTCEISRPTLSQILTGRNKKISNLLVSQIHTGYPQLNIMWLMFGEGSMMSNIPREEDISTDVTEDAEKSEFGESSLFALDPSIEVSGFERDAPARSKKVSTDERTIRKISHITVYYDDQTFETFYPKK